MLSLESAAEIAAIAELLRAAGDVSSTRLLASAAGTRRLHLSPARANLLRHLELSGLSILELGAGCGGLSRLLAERAARFTAIEARPLHREALAARLHDLPRVRVAEEAEPGELFDLVVVTESGEPESPEDFAARLQTGIARLRPGGVLALAGGNRLGLGAFAGQPDRQSRTYFSGPAGGEVPGEGRSRLEWRRHLAGLGLEILAEYLLSPDIWLPTCVLEEELVGRDLELAADLICHLPFADATLPAFPLVPPALLAESMARGGLLAELAPGYLWLLGRPGSETLVSSLRGPRAGDAGRSLGWHYSAERQPATATRFFLRDESLWVEKSALTPAPERPGVRWHAPPPAPLLRGQRWRQRLLRAAYFETGDFEDALAGLLASSREPFLASGGKLDGRALDAIVHNAILGEDGQTRFFDLEWELLEAMPASWWVLRNVLAWTPNLDTAGHGIGSADLAELYHRLCARLGIPPALEQDLDREAQLQSDLGGGDLAASRAAIAAALERPLAISPFPPRRPENFGPWQEAIERRNLEIQRLTVAFGSLSKLAEDVRWLGEAVASQQRSLESIDTALRWLAEKIVEKV